jgi:CcmD family protein
MTKPQNDSVHADPGLGPGYQLAKTQAQPVGTAERPEDRSQQFVAVTGGAETTSASSLLVSAYIVIWVLLFAFLFLGFRRSQRIEARLSGLEDALSRRESEKGDD